MIISAKSLLDMNLNPTRADVKQAIRGNLCRCTGYKKIEDAILMAAEFFREKKQVPPAPKTLHMDEHAKRIDGVTVYGDFTAKHRAAIVSLNIRDWDSAEVSDVLYADYGIATRPGAHCAPRLHEALGTVRQGAVRFSFSVFNSEDEVDMAIQAVKELAQSK